MGKIRHKELDVLYFENKQGFLEWLKTHWEQAESVWLKFAKKDSMETSLSYEEAREAAICYGWIDGLIYKCDADFYLLKFSKRRPRSTWSKINREIAETLIRQKKMRISGKAEVERAKADGRWAAAYDSPKNMTVPKWFVTEVKKDNLCAENFLKLNKSELYAIAYNLRTAKREETKQRRAEKYLNQLREKK